MSLLNRARLLFNGVIRIDSLRIPRYTQAANRFGSRYFSFHPPSYIIKISPIVKPKARSAVMSPVSPIHNLEQALKSQSPENAWSSFTRLLITPNEKFLASTHFSSLLDTLLTDNNKKLAHKRCIALLSHMKRLRTTFQTLREFFPLVKFYLLFSHQEDLKKLIQLLIENFSFSEKECNQLIHQIGSSNVKEAWNFYQQTNSLLLLGEQPLFDLISLAMKHNEGAIINEIGDHLFSFETKPTQLICQNLVRAYTNCCSLDSVLKLYHQVENVGLLNTRVYNMLIDFFKKATRFDLCVHMFNELTRNQVAPDIITFTSMMQVYAKTSNIQSAEDMLKKLVEEGLSPDVITYTTLVSMYAKVSEIGKAHNLISDMEKNGIKPTLYTYTALLDGYSLLNDVDGAIKVFHRMEANGIRPDITAYNTLLRAYLKHPCDNEIRKILNEMIERKCEPNSITYTILMRYYSEHGDEAKMDELENTLLADARSSSFMYRTLIDTYLALFDWNRAIRVYETMKSQHANSLTDVYNIILKYLTRQSDETRLLEFFHCEDTRNVGAYNILLNYFQQHSKISELKELYESMQKRGVRGDLTTFSILISAYSNIGDLNRTLNVFDSMQSKGIQPDRKLYNTLISTCFKHNESDIAFNIYQTMLDQKINADQYTLTILMDHYNRIGEMENVFRIWERLVQDFPKETLGTSISVLLDSIGFNGNLDTLKTMWKKLQTERYILDENNFSSYIESLCRFGAHEDAIRVFMHEMSSIQPSQKTCELLLKSLVSYQRKKDVTEIMDFLKSKNPGVHSVLAKIL